LAFGTGDALGRLDFGFDRAAPFVALLAFADPSRFFFDGIQFFPGVPAPL
jgi:hypothetical protein